MARTWFWVFSCGWGGVGVGGRWLALSFGWLLVLRAVGLLYVVLGFS